jgi:hypothetical protein
MMAYSLNLGVYNFPVYIINEIGLKRKNIFAKFEKTLAGKPSLKPLIRPAAFCVIFKLKLSWQEFLPGGNV